MWATSGSTWPTACKSCSPNSFSLTLSGWHPLTAATLASAATSQDDCCKQRREHPGPDMGCPERHGRQPRRTPAAAAIRHRGAGAVLSRMLQPDGGENLPRLPAELHALDVHRDPQRRSLHCNLHRVDLHGAARFLQRGAVLAVAFRRLCRLCPRRRSRRAPDQVRNALLSENTIILLYTSTICQDRLGTNT